MHDVLRIRLSFDRIEPEIWRRLDVPNDLSLAALHEAIQLALGWSGTHLWEFTRDRTDYGLPFEDGISPDPEDARTVTLRDVLDSESDRLRYLYDFGDHWTMRLEVEAPLSPDDVDDAPQCAEGERAAPPEDCGGVAAYQQLVGAFRAETLDPEVSEWLGDWDPDVFKPSWVQLPSAEGLERRAREHASRAGAAPVGEADGAPQERASRTDMPPLDAPARDDLDAMGRQRAGPMWDPVLELLDPAEIETTDELVEHLKEEFQADYGPIDQLPIDEKVLEQEIREVVEEDFAWFGSDYPDAVNPDVDDLETFPTSNALADGLARLPVDQLDTIFEKFDFDERPSRRGEREEKIADHLTSEGTVDHLLEARLDEPAHRIATLLAEQPSHLPITSLLTSDLVDPRSPWLDFHGDTPLGRLRRLGLVHLGLRTLGGDDYVYVGVLDPLDESVSSWAEANRTS